MLNLATLPECNKYREATEWANYWWDNAYEDRKDRILLIGDSTSRQYRSTLARLSNRPVDFLGTSSTITDSLFKKELNLFFSFEEYNYDSIHIQLGCHGIVMDKSVTLPVNYYDYYEKAYRELVQFLMSNCNRLVLATSTNIVEDPSKRYSGIFGRLYSHFHSVNSETIDEKYDNDLKVRNSIVSKIASENNLKINDLYAYMLNGGGKHFKHSDHVHFEKRSNVFIVKEIMSYLQL